MRFVMQLNTVNSRLYLVLSMVVLLLAVGSTSARTRIMSRSAVAMRSHTAADRSIQSLTGSMNAARREHLATLLADGSVLAVGGVGNTAQFSSTERYDPTTGAWRNSGTLSSPQDASTATVAVLPDNTLLLVENGEFRAPALAERYYPIDETWHDAGTMHYQRFHPAVVVLGDGSVLAIGGDNDSTGSVAPTTVERYDAVANTWSVISQLTESVFAPTATLLSDGTILVVGSTEQPCGQYCVTRLPFAARYRPWTNTWMATTAMVGVPWTHTATHLANGTVLVIVDDTITPATSAQIYDPRTDAWRPVMNLRDWRGQEYTATALADGCVLVLGGMNYATGAFLRSAEIYDPRSRNWLPARTLDLPRAAHSATLLPNGTVLVAGGFDRLPDGTPFSTASAELYDVAGALKMNFLPLVSAAK